MENGWILLHRKILENPICKNPTWAWLWIILLLLASHTEKKDFIWNGKPIKLKKGQFITGRKKLKEITGIPETTIERVLNYLEKSGHQIEQQKTTKFRLITILNWDKYQKLDTKADNRRTTDGQQTDTINNVNKDNNDNELTHSAEPKLENQIFDIFYKTINPNINYAHKGNRNDAKWLIDRYGLEKVSNAAKYAISVQGKPYAPTINTPSQLKVKMADLMAYKNKQENNQANQKKGTLIL